MAAMSTTLIDRLNAIVETGEISRSGLARAAGLHPNSLRKLGQPDWNPTADTLGRLERLILRGTSEVLVGAEAIIAPSALGTRTPTRVESPSAQVPTTSATASTWPVTI